MPSTAADHLRAAIRILRQQPDQTAGAVAVELALAVVESGDFGQLLRRRRERLGWSIQDVADRTGLTTNTLRNLETGRTAPAPDSMERLLNVRELEFGVADAAGPVTPIELQPNSYLPLRYDPSGMAHDLRAAVNGPGGTLEQSLLYLDSQSAADYLAVCEAYGSTRGGLFAELHAVAVKVAALGTPVEVVAIGSGDGRAEVCLTRALVGQRRVSRLYLLDISHTLLTKANEHAGIVLRPEGVDVKSVHGNFHDLPRYPMLHAGPGKPRRLYTLLGATLANLADELRFFRDLYSCAARGDLLLLDYQIAHDPPDDDPTLKAGAIPKIFFDWHAGPLLRNNPHVRSVKMFPQLGPGRVAGSYIIASVAEATLDDGARRHYRMMNSARYSPTILSQVLTGAGWETIYSASYDARTAVMLLQRS